MTTLRLSATSNRRITSADTSGWLRFDVHGRVHMGVSRTAQAAAQMTTMFADFLVPDGDADRGRPFDLTVSGQFEDITGVAFAEDDFSYRSDAVCLRSPRL